MALAPGFTLVYAGNMDGVSVLVGLAIGFVLGLVLAVLMVRGKEAAARAADRSEWAEERAALEVRNARVPALEEQLGEARQEASDLRVRATQLETTLEGERSRQDEKLSELKEARELLASRFKQLAQEVLEDRTRVFDEQSKKSMEGLIKPLREQLEGFRKKLGETHKEATKERVSLEHELKRLRELNTRIGDEARSLTLALKGDSKVQGNWGEVVLARILEMSGLEEGREYEREVSETDDEGRRKRPDVIVRLPGNRHVVVDAKVSLTAYEAYCGAEDAASRDAALKAHVASVRTHVKELSAKGYPQLDGLETVDYVLMFMPIEAAFTEAIRSDRALFDDAINRSVVVVTPSTLLATLRTIQTIWRREYQTRNVQQIADRAGKLYDKFVGFVEDIMQIGKRIEQTRQAYDGALNKLSTGTGNLVRRAEELKTLGAKASKNLPEALVEHAGASVVPALELVAPDSAPETDPSSGS